ncbi:TPA: (2Fe-2S)-binding protein, partial [Candidatus Uhrbacteria bacterium]|nr:(2Fe-2S)-binding protein [Candidatus Uhrbacteria bacterium]
MSGIALLRRNQDPSLNVIKRALSGNLCRCTGYSAIYDGVREA